MKLEAGWNSAKVTREHAERALEQYQQLGY